MVTLPRFLQVEPVGQCNLRCQMCPIQFRQDGPPHGPPAFMDFDVFTRLIDQFPDLEELQLQGLGEPMMHPRFFDMVAHAVRRGIRVGTNTNLTLLNARRAELCVTSGLGELHASIDGATAAVYDRIRVRAHFERIITNLERLVETRARLASETPRIRMVVVAMRQNIHELPDLVRLAHRLAISAVFVQHLCHDFQESSLPAQYRPMRDFVTSETLTSEVPDRVQRHFDEARGVARELGVDLRLPRTRLRLHPPGTTGPGVVLTSATRVLQCPVAWSPLLTGSSLAAWLSAAPWPSGTARTTRPSAISSRRITRRRSAGRARSTRERSELSDEDRVRGPWCECGQWLTIRDPPGGVGVVFRWGSGVSPPLRSPVRSVTNSRRVLTWWSPWPLVPQTTVWPPSRVVPRT